MASFPSQEHRPLKKMRLGLYGPDVYPQDKKQKEDELTPLIVKHGFSNMPPTKDEYGSARDSNPASSKVGAAFSAIVAKKFDINTFPDQTKRKLPLNTKDNFYLAQISRGKAVLELWFRDLSSTKSLMQMVKKVPVFNKKEETFHKLCEENVPLFRCAWFIKMTNAYNTTLCEATKAKKRQAMDPFLEWSQALARYLREQLMKILEHYQGSVVQTGFLTASTAPSITSLEQVMRNWNFGMQMALYLYEEGLLDRHEFLTWLVELLEKLKVTDDTVLKLILAQVLKYMSEFVQSQLLSRRLVFFCCKKLAQICSDSPSLPPSSQSPNVSASADSSNVPMQVVASQTSLQSIFTDYSNCYQHRSLLLSICSIIQAVTLSCPSALVWHNLGEGKSSSSLSGSPLDLLPCPISSLPMPQGNDNNSIRAQLKACEEQIIARSKAAEVHWSADKNQQSAIGSVVNKVLAGLEVLDRHNFEKVELSNCLDVLYNKLFTAQQAFCKDGCENVALNEATINLLCEWAVTTKRTGEHRAVVVAKLLEKYQCDILSDKLGDGDGMDDRDSVASDAGPSFTPPFQTLLMQFLDKNAPTCEDNDSVDTKQAFANLVLLFSELILHDIFSHDAYICTLISRGDIQLSSNVNQPLSSVTPCQTDSIKSEGLKFEMPDEMKSEHECHNLESEFGLFAFKDELRPSPDQPGSVKSSFEQSVFAGTPGQAQTPIPCYSQVNYSSGAPHTPISVRTPAPHTPGASHTPGAATPGSATSGAAPTPGMYYSMVHTPNVAHTPGSLPPPFSQSLPVLSVEQSVLQNKESSSRHLIFVTHFPIAVDDLSCHESNQRLVILYGVGRQRDEARHLLKRVTKDVGKLFSKKSCLDTNFGDTTKLKKKKEKEPNDSGMNLENIFNKFRKLSYYDQHAVTNTVSRSVVEVVSNFASANSTYLPLIDNISYMFDLMEYCLNISHLLELAIKLLKEQPDVEAQLMLRASALAGGYTTSLCLCIVGVLRKYHACLLVSQEQTATAFESLVKVVKHVDKPNDCTSPERSILAYLYDLYTSCYYLRTKYSDLFGGPCTKVKNTLYADVEPSSSNLRWEEHFSKDLMDNPKLKVEIQFVKQLNDTPANRYSFVCSAIVNICNCQSVDRLNDIAILCTELTACCTSLSSEWLGVLKALCWSSNHNCGFIDVLTQVDVGDFSIHDSLAVFTAILIARHCFTLEDLVGHVALQSLLAACPSVGSGGDPDAELGARLTCHLLLRLFQMMNTMPGYLPEHRKNSVYVKSSCDRHLLEAEHKRINVGAVVAVLKAILMLGDSCHAEQKDRPGAAKKDMSVDFITLANLDDCADMSLRIGGASQAKGCVESAGLSDYAKYCLREICSQEWVREKFLKEPDQLFKADLLLDKMLSHKQAQQLVQMICYPGGTPNVALHNEEDDDEDDEPEQRRHLTRILHCMDQWSQRVSGLELQLMIKQATQSEMPSLLENIAKSTIEVFQREADSVLNNANKDGKSAISGMDSRSVWLIAPLIAKLNYLVQGRVLKTAGQVLETGNNFWSAKNSKDRERYLQRSTSLLGNQPFLSLVLTCLKGQNEQREGLLKSLHDQLEKFVTNAKEQQDRGVPPDEKIQYLMQEALQLRLSLVGNMFDTIQHNNNLTQDWAILLIQLISHGIVDVQTSCELFTTVMDMLAVLIHGTLANDTSDNKGEDNKKSYQSLIRKLKKELGERKSTSIDMVRQLLPLPKKYCEVIVCDMHSADTKGTNKSQDVDRKHSLQISRKERVSPWEILEGHKNPAPLNLSWFGAVKLEKKQLKYEEQHRLLLYHTHSLRKPAGYFLEPPVLPPEDLDRQLDKPEVKPLEQILEPKPEFSKTKKGNQKVRQPRKAPRNSITPTASTFPQNVPPINMNFARPEAFPSGPPSNWYGQPQYSQQITPARAFPLPRPITTALKARVQTPNAFLPSGNWPHGGVRQRQPMAGRRVCADPGMFAQQAGMINQGFPGYSNYPQTPQNLAPQAGMIEQNQPALNPNSFTPPYQGANAALGLSNQSASYLSSQNAQQTQYPASSARYAALPVMTNIGPQGSVPGSSMSNYGQLSSGRQVPGQASNFKQQQRILIQNLPQHQASNPSSLMRQMAGNNTSGANQPQNSQYPPFY